MLYKLYIQRFKEGSLDNYELFKDIARIYRDNGVIVLGHWINSRAKNETVLITVYKDEAHHQRFVDKMQSDPQYRKRQEFLSEIRESFEVRELELNKHSLLQPNDAEFREYVEDVKLIMEEYDQ
ncbi:MAG: hypothetical protein ACW99A_09605 [Candidatus Kariarchaeaceae archaeon]|jgi:hypothetical protein